MSPPSIGAAKVKAQLGGHDVIDLKLSQGYYYRQVVISQVSCDAQDKLNLSM